MEIWQAFINVLGEITRGQVLSGLIGALIATALAHFLRVNREERTTRKIRDRHLAALAAEIDYCAQLAGTYVDEPYAAPLYRFPTTVYATVYAKLVSETLSGEDVTALTAFYSQVEQMNRGLDAIERYRAVGDQANMQNEYGRLLVKAQAMRHRENQLRKPSVDSQLYENAITAVRRLSDKARARWLGVKAR